jgi:hypothetical protein
MEEMSVAASAAESGAKIERIGSLSEGGGSVVVPAPISTVLEFRNPPRLPILAGVVKSGFTRKNRSRRSGHVSRKLIK